MHIVLHRRLIFFHKLEFYLFMFITLIFYVTLKFEGNIHGEIDNTVLH